MEVKKQIQRFRNEALMSRYDKAIQLGNSILQKLKENQEGTFLQDSERIQHQIRKQIDLCIQLSKFVTQNHQRKEMKINQLQKANKQQQMIEYKPRSKSTWNKNKLQCHSKNQTQQRIQIKSEKQIILQTHINQTQQQSIEERLYKHLILPINMPLFKLKQSLHLIITQNCINQVINYLVEYDFKQFETLQIQDLGVQNIFNAKIQMIQMNFNRAFIVVESSDISQKSNIKNKIGKLNKIIEAYKQIEKEDIKNKVVLVLLVQNKNHSQNILDLTSPIQIPFQNQHSENHKLIFFY